jgi:glutathione-regulated potassium-efflux system ancillary protein KefG
LFCAILYPFADRSCSYSFGRSDRSLMKRILILFAHPALERSRVNRLLIRGVRDLPGVTFHDLYEEYPDFNIDVSREQSLLVDHDILILQHPLFWYSTPALLKEWQDLVLEHGFAYGSDGDRLAGKRMMLAVTAAGPEEAYSAGGYQHYSLRDFLRPLEQTARLCSMRFTAPYVLYSSLKAPSTGDVEPHVDGYRRLLEAIRDDRYDWDEADRRETVDLASLPIRAAD